MSSPIRISGLTSGLDTDNIIKDLMKIEQLKVDRETRNKTSLEWKRDAYAAVNTQIKEFREKYFSVLNSESNMLSAGTFKANKVTMTSNNAINLTASSSAFASKLVIASVQMAKSASIASDSKGQSQRAGLTSSAHVLKAQSVGEATTIANSGVTLNDASLTNTDGKNIFGFSDTVDTVKFAINGKEISLTKDMTVAQAMDAINNSDAGVTMTFDTAENPGKFTLQSKGAGANATMTIANTVGTAFGSDSGFGISTGTVAAKTVVVKQTSTLEDLAKASGKTAADTMEFTINGQAFSFTKDQTINDVMTAVNGNVAANVTMQFDEKLGTFSVRSDTAGAGTSVTIANTTGNLFGTDSITNINTGSSTAYDTIKRTDALSTAASKLGKTLATNASGLFEVKVQGKTFTFEPTATVQTMTDAINNANLGVKVNYSEISDSFSFTTSTTGSSSTLALEGFGSLGVSTLNATGNDATVVLDTGEKIVQSTNSFKLDGITFEIKGDYTDATPITAELTQDLDSVVTKFKQFVTDYNTLITSLNAKLSEKKEYDFYPLTTAEKEEMTEDEIKTWETKAKSGLLRGDSALSSMLTSMRTAMYDAVEGTGLKPSDLGLKSSTYSSSGELQKGQLVFDSSAEQKLRAALKKDPDAVAKALSNLSTAEDATTKYKESGFFGRISIKMNLYYNAARTGTIKNTEKAITNSTTKISDLTDMMETKRTQFYLKFSKMESMMTSLNAQSSWFSAQMGLSS